MHFTEPVYRNPYWPTWPLLEVTHGCTHNRCKFCTMYKGVPFGMSPMEQVEEDLAELAATTPHARTIQLLSANPLALSYDTVTVLEMLPDICNGGELFHTMRLKDYLDKHATVLTSVATKKVTPDSVEYEDADHVRHTIPADLVAVCAGQRKVGLDLYEELVDVGYEVYRIGNNERAANFLNATRSAFELAYTI